MTALKDLWQGESNWTPAAPSIGAYGIPQSQPEGNMNLPGVPESIPIERVRQMLTELGLPIDQITQDGIRVGWNTITCTVYATHPKSGGRYVDQLTGKPAVHHITIPIIHEP